MSGCGATKVDVPLNFMDEQYDCFFGTLIRNVHVYRWVGFVKDDV